MKNGPKSTLNNIENEKIDKHRYNAIILLTIGGLINYIDRSNLSISATYMMHDLHLNAADIGLMGTVFSWTYAIMQLPSGWLIDKFGAKKLYTIAISAWSIITAITGTMNHLWTLLIGRATLGIAEAPCWPSGAKITSDWFPKKERALATGFWDSSSKIGPAIAAPIIVTLIISIGWRGLFFATGLIGAIFSFFFYLFYQRPTKDKHLTKKEHEYIIKGSGPRIRETKISWSTWKRLFRYRSIWGIILGDFCYLWVFNIFVYFLPLYLTNKFHVSTASLSFYASVPWIGGVIGDIGGGWLSNKMVSYMHIETFVSKRLVIVICAIGAGISVIYIPFVNSVNETVAIMAIALAFLSSISSNAWALPGDIVPESMVASVSSIQNFGGFFGGALSPAVAGLIVDSTGSYSIAFISGGIITTFSAFCYWFIVKKPLNLTV